MIIQIIGLPAIGKTTLIKKYLKNNKLNVKYLDIRDFSFPKREKKLIDYVSDNSGKYIIESACGIEMHSSIVIMLDKKFYFHQKQLKQRGDNLSSIDLLALKDQMIPADYTLNDFNYLDDLLNYYLA